ncbi:MULTISPECIES: hypothetical protein [Streptomyces]|uniref:Secreted protein n=1 Tax=Streptomyces solicathayae TaxID=3081768 RepID=A0ABZ0LWN4_9ACTN|nr:hypothetical protein [Streptomyces sp. HUAS YS2]WOX23921.1 hypothetical protein R2D22_22040 [Streptomyces sp. HUAS YS2]
MSAFWKRRRVRLTAAWTAGAVAVAGGLFWLSGGYDAWRHDSALDSACEGDLAAGPLRALLDGAEVTTSIRSGTRGWSCKVDGVDSEEDGRNWLVVSVQRADDRAVGIDADGRDAPLGHGWTGSFSFSPDRDEDDRGEATAALMLDCGKEPGDGLVATVSARLHGADFTRPAARTRLTEVLTGTAASYARRTGCAAAKPGGAVGDPGVSVTSWDYRPFGTVSGACAGVLDAATAARWGVVTAVESPAGPKPIEGCTLGGLQGTELYALTAHYGPFVGLRRLDARDAAREPGDRPDGHYFLTARCPGAGDTAVYEIRPRADRFASPLALDHTSLRAALKTFADRSAKTHACAPPS